MRDRDRGVAAVLALFSIVVLGALAALVINTGMMLETRAELQTASESAALAGARALDGTTGGISNARLAAKQYSAGHVAWNSPVTITDDDILFGAWHFKPSECTYGSDGDDCFQPLDPGTDAGLITSVRVLNRR